MLSDTPALLPETTTWGATRQTLLPIIRQALTAGAERAALLLPVLPAEPRRAARLLLQDAARAGDGAALEAASGELLLLGARSPSIARCVQALAALGLPPGIGMALDPEAGAPLLAWAAQAVPAPRPDLALAGRAEMAAAAGASEGCRVARTVLGLGPDVAPRRFARHWSVSRRRLAAALGPALAAEPDLLAETLARAEAGLAGAAPDPQDLPPLMLRPGGGPPPGPRAIALLPLAAAAEPAALARQRAALLASGWADLGLDGLDAAVLSLLDLAGLPAEGPLLLRWSPSLAERDVAQVLRGLTDPRRFVLTGCSDSEAMAWGLEVGIRRFAGPAVEALIAAARQEVAA